MIDAVARGGWSAVHLLEPRGAWWVATALRPAQPLKVSVPILVYNGLL